MNRNILHVGYEVKDPDIKSKLEPYIEDKVNELRDNIFTAVLFYKSSSQQMMNTWYTKRSRKQDPVVTGFVKQLYISKNCTVATVTVEGQWHYLTLVANTTTPLIDIKRLANSGALGEPITVDIKLLFKPYKQ